MTFLLGGICTQGIPGNQPMVLRESTPLWQRQGETGFLHSFSKFLDLLSKPRVWNHLLHEVLALSH